jgi:phosphatidate cytidylyltransferase
VTEAQQVVDAHRVQSGGAFKGFGIRVVSGLVLIAIAFVVTWLGGWALGGWVALASSRMIYEWERMTNRGGWTLGFFIGGAAIIAACVFATMGHFQTALYALGIGGAAGAIWAINERKTGTWALLGILYIGLPSVGLIWLREGAGGGAPGITTLLWLLMVVWASDIFAMLVGSTIGGPKLAPILSPKKTWSGFIGALVAAGLISFGFAYMLKSPAPVTLVVLGLLLSLVAQLDDMAESALKRRFKRKDAGQLIPGHGGFLDRMDSLLFAAFVLALFRLAFPAAPFGLGWFS